VDHLKLIADEFTRQAQNFDNWAAKADDPHRFTAALGKARKGKLLDVACGPGVVTAALAPDASTVVAFDATEQMLEPTVVTSTVLVSAFDSWRGHRAPKRAWIRSLSPIRDSSLRA
jgi:2-polyprenyl-3-methyl-5-hydroxy-6-metoxy-1,4-benzoquinol methylase